MSLLKERKTEAIGNLTLTTDPIPFSTVITVLKLLKKGHSRQATFNEVEQAFAGTGGMKGSAFLLVWVAEDEQKSGQRPLSATLTAAFTRTGFQSSPPSLAPPTDRARMALIIPHDELKETTAAISFGLFGNPDTTNEPTPTEQDFAALRASIEPLNEYQTAALTLLNPKDGPVWDLSPEKRIEIWNVLMGEQSPSYEKEFARYLDLRKEFLKWPDKRCPSCDGKGTYLSGFRAPARQRPTEGWRDPGTDVGRRASQAAPIGAYLGYRVAAHMTGDRCGSCNGTGKLYQPGVQYGVPIWGQ